MCNIARSYVTWIISYVTWRIHTWLNTCLCHMTTSHVTWLIHYDTLRFHVCTRRFQYLCWVFLCSRLVALFGTLCTCFCQYIERCSMCIERYSINIEKNSIHMRVVLKILLVNRKMLNVYWKKLDIYAYGIEDLICICDIIHVQQIADRVAQHLEIISKKTPRTRILPMGFTISTK